MLLKSRNAIVEFLKKRVSGSYEGFIGVDQFVYEYGGTDDGPKYRFNPVVEINLRMTMGFAARAVMNRLAPEAPMLLRVGPDGIHLCPETLSSSIS